jgi:hypothetical protein
MDKERETQILEWLQDIKDKAQEIIAAIDNGETKAQINKIKQISEHTINIIYKTIK